MFYEGDYWVKSIDDDTFNVKKHGRRSMKGRNFIMGLSIPDGVELERNDVVRLKIENHSEESGDSSHSWALDRFMGFPYDKERGWAPLDGLGDES
jgi:hypothetical protein